MSEATQNVNYELAYRLLLLITETTEGRHEGSSLNLDHAHRILGVEKEELDRTFEVMKADMLVTASNNGTLYIG